MATRVPVGHRSRLLLKTVDLLKNRPRSLKLRTISEDLSLPQAWLEAITYLVDEEPTYSPSVDRVETLYCYLTGKQLDI